MLTDIIMKKEREEDQKLKLNSSRIHLNRGFELMLEEDITSKPNTRFFKFGKVLSLFSREIHLNFSLEIIKK